MSLKEVICTVCPQGCPLQVEILADSVRVSGHACKRGVNYAEEEIRDPKRVVTTTVSVRGGVLPLVPVRTKEPVPKSKVHQVLAEVRGVVLEAPVSLHQVVRSSVAGTDVDVVTTRPIAAK